MDNGKIKPILITKGNYLPGLLDCCTNNGVEYKVLNGLQNEEKIEIVFFKGLEQDDPNLDEIRKFIPEDYTFLAPVDWEVASAKNIDKKDPRYCGFDWAINPKGFSKEERDKFPGGIFFEYEGEYYFYCNFPKEYEENRTWSLRLKVLCNNNGGVYGYFHAMK